MAMTNVPRAPASPSADRRYAPGAMVALYASMVVVAILVFAAIQRVGSHLTASEPLRSAVSVEARGGVASLVQVLVALATIVGSARLLGVVAVKLGQPPVVGEILAGLALGPSLFGRVAPGLASWLLPPSVSPALGVFSQVGVILYMFLVGLELDPDELKRQRHASIVISHASIAVPFLSGAALALLLYPHAARGDVPFTAFALFCGTAMSVTAFPVLTRILRDRGMLHSRVGTLATACAAVDDVTAWCLLALVVGVVKGNTSRAVLTVAGTVLYLGMMLGIARPALRRRLAASGERDVTEGALGVTVVALLLSSVTTELIGIHAIFGAFILGVVVPSGSALARGIAKRVEGLIVILLLPVFFVHAGAHVELGLLRTPWDGALLLLIIVIACAGKGGGTVLAARLTGQPWRDSLALAALMNTRGLVELVVLDLGLQLGVLTPALFTMFVIMALVTTAATSPLLSWIARGRESSHRPPSPPCIPEQSS